MKWLGGCLIVVGLAVIAVAAPRGRERIFCDPDDPSCVDGSRNGPGRSRTSFVARERADAGAVAHAVPVSSPP